MLLAMLSDAMQSARCVRMLRSMRARASALTTDSQMNPKYGMVVCVCS